jgi:hypothetical protein
MKIHETTNYRKFELHNFNRDVLVKTKRFKNLLASMEKHGWIEAYPMHTVQNGSNKLKIKAGHNRFTAAQMLKIPVKYVICDDKSELQELENSTKPWNLADHMRGYARQGDPNYLKLESYVRKYGIPANTAILLLEGGNKFSGGYVDRFKTGNFRVGNPTHAEKVGEFVLYCVEIGIPFAKNSRFVFALSKVLNVDGVIEDELKYKLKNHLYFVTKQADVPGYVAMLEKVYNRQRGKKLAIAINAL